MRYKFCTEDRNQTSGDCNILGIRWNVLTNLEISIKIKLTSLYLILRKTERNLSDCWRNMLRLRSKNDMPQATLHKVNNTFSLSSSKMKRRT